MAVITVKIPRQQTWSHEDIVQLLFGSENAASLAASSPVGGRVVAEQLAFADAEQKGGFGFGVWGASGGGGFRWGLNPLPAFGWGDPLVQWGSGFWGWNLIPQLELTAKHVASDICATLPIGVRVLDVNGNISNVSEQVVQISDPPRGVRNVSLAGTATPGEVVLTWTPSPHV